MKPHIRPATIATLLTFSGLLGSPFAMAIEEPEYEILQVAENVDFRRYDPYIVAAVDVRGAAADRTAFRILAGYIFGDNSSGEKMAMTAPVEKRGDEYAFVMERKYSMETLPRPADDRIRLQIRQPRIVAVRRFSGRWSARNIARNEQALLEDLVEMGIETSGPPELARYNSPFMPWFLRRNEIIVPVIWPAHGTATDVAPRARARL